jgi:hypothetical protein
MKGGIRMPPLDLIFLAQEEQPDVVSIIIGLAALLLPFTYWLFRRLRDLQTPERWRQREQEKEEDQRAGYEADANEVQRFLQQLGGRRRPEPEPPPPPKTEQNVLILDERHAAPGRPPARERKRRARLLEENLVAAEEIEEVGGLADRIAFPRLSPLQRAVVLSELLARRRGRPRQPIA